VPPGASVTPPSFLTEAMKPHIRSFTFDGPVPAGVPGIRNGTLNDRGWGVARNINMGNVANRVFEVSEDPLIPPVDNNIGPLWSLPFDYRMIMNAAIPSPAPAGECLQGIQWGSFGQATPWQTNYAAAIIGPVVQFRYNYTRAKWEILVWDQDNGLAPHVVDCTLQPTFTPDLYIKELRLLYLPHPTSSQLLAYLNGQLVHTYTGTRLQNCYGQSAGSYRMAGYFVTNGSGLTVMTECTFYTNRVWQPFLYPVPPNPA